ncbi:transposase [Methylocaldum sp. 14B]|jgi:putative transposase|uniref:REP-associated tyrosine transposase n=1 Tax=Methylocaldum sp. 14B TaxID=1912213 RepID=UPI00098AEDAE|nr:transposase [Methylocaldum sp. 14B]
MRVYKRAKIAGGVYFFTVNLAERCGNDLLTRHIADLREAFKMTRKSHPFSIEAIVVLPDHLHCVWQLPPADDDFSTRWRLIKARFSRRIDGEERISASRRRKGERGIWQRRYWEHVIRDERDYHRHLDYIHFNPVKHGYVQSPKDWPYSSFHRWVERGVYPADWASISPDVAACQWE